MFRSILEPNLWLTPTAPTNGRITPDIRALRPVLAGILRVGSLRLLRFELELPLGEGVGDVHQEDEPQDDVLEYAADPIYPDD